ncbi:zinc-binding dehydrogenase [Microbacterium sp. SORGH_AS_0888]|uniref:zinc-binding dehydrogenase n=1 Tax=Microbacterium sp. SORGH_AS_0888 TaxID=3041791 RepID=UPI0027813A9B|nr:zinc-binding dehydrogenase [Microbacterium sp. SORGH_AS_0888]MDQ1131301.1 NADPH2:quinone reductase [Microbacterium sp. SORGH_AS_0888]
MKAWVQTGFGGPEVRRLIEVAAPSAAPDEVVVRTLALALNRLDVLQRREPVVAGMSVPHVAGMDLVGEVVTVGSSPESRRLLGATVLVDPVVSCGDCDYCRANTPTYCSAFATIGSTRPGGMAELVAVPARNCTVVDVDPGDDARIAELAALPVACATAWRGLLGAGRLEAGETVVIPGAGSGLGAAGVQIALSRGAKVITMVSGAAKAVRAAGLGAHHVIDRTATSDWVAEVHRLTGGVGADMVWDHVGGEFLGASLRATRPGGRVVLSGTTAGLDMRLHLPDLYQPGRSILGHGSYSRQDMSSAIAAFTDGQFSVVLDSVWPFERLDEAEARLESNEFFGKIVVRGPGAVVAAEGQETP